MADIRRKLEQLQVRPSKGRGQNFLIDPFAAASIAQFGDLSQQHGVVEIGPGLGALTSHLCTAAKLHLIEVEPAFAEALRREFPTATVIERDVREVSFADLGSELAVYGNLPYSLSTSIILHLLAQREAIKSAVLLLQREFAERLAASPGGREFGRLTVLRTLYAEARLGAIIPADSFHPRPKVESRIVRLDFLQKPLVGVEEVPAIERLVQAAFSSRRKTVLNSLRSSGAFDPRRIEAALEALAIDPKRRAETLQIEEFVGLARLMAQ